jgi:energy-coupling factor transporter ATP-binding protein EcfA2
MAEQKKGGVGYADAATDGRAWLILICFIVSVLVLIPAILAGVAWWLLRNRLRKLEAYVLLATGVIGFGLNPQQHVVQYGRWLVVLFSGNRLLSGSRLDVPWLSLLCLTLTLTGLALALSGTRIAEIGMTRIGRKRAAIERSWKQKTGKGIYDKEDILPTDKQRAQVVNIVPPTGALKVDPSAHSINSEQKPGSRDFPIGIGVRGQPVTLNEKEIGMHVLIFGSTGSGKSETIKAFAGGLLDLGWDGIIIDLKEDTKPGGLRDWCYEYAVHHGKPYQELRLSNLRGEYWFNPLAGMGPDEMRDTILSLNSFEAAYWEAINKQMLGQLINLFMDAHAVDPIAFPQPTMLDIGRTLSATSLATACKKMAATVLATMSQMSKETYSSVLNPNKDQQTSAAGLGAKLTLIYDTQAGRYVLQPGNNRREFDVTQPGLAYVGLDSQGKPDLTRIISSALLQRLSVYSAARATGTMGKNPAPRFVIIDEANWVDKKIVQNLLSRARSANLSIVLATQSPLDWANDPEMGDMFAVLSQNANVCIAMSQGEPEAATRLAEYIGTSRQVQQMQRVVGDQLQAMGSARVMDDYIITPDQLRRLTIGEAILRVGKPTTRIEWASVKMRDPKV